MIGGLAKNHKMSIFNMGLAGWSAVDSYQTAREEGSGVGMSLVSAGVDAALPMMLGGWQYMALQAAMEAPGAIMKAHDALGTYQRNMAKSASNRAFANAHFDDTQQAFTMRQAGMAIAERSKYNMQQARMGNEARFMRK